MSPKNPNNLYDVRMLTYFLLSIDNSMPIMNVLETDVLKFVFIVDFDNCNFEYLLCF